MNLYLNGAPLQQLNDEMNQQTIDLDIGLIGGKVHGSLARAGKVKGQTPKVNFYEQLFLKFWKLKKKFNT